MKCQSCGDEIALDPEFAVQEDEIECVVEFTYSPDDSVAVSETEYFCDPECFVEKYGGGA
jgi:hypothetical protein